MIAAMIDADARRRQHPADVNPSGVLMKDADGADVADEQHRQHDAGRFTRAEQEREDQDVHQAHAGEPGFANADPGRRDDREHPLRRTQVRHRDPGVRSLIFQSRSKLITVLQDGRTES